MANENGNTARLWGIPINLWFQFISTIGIPGVLILVITLMAYQHFPRLVDGHLTLLQDTSSTLQSMAETQEKMAEAVDALKTGIQEVVDVERSTKEFMRQVEAHHQEQNDKLDALLEQTKDP